MNLPHKRSVAEESVSEEDLLNCEPRQKRTHLTDSLILNITQPRKPRIGPDFQAVIPEIQQPARVNPARLNPAAASLAALGLLTQEGKASAPVQDSQLQGEQQETKQHHLVPDK